MAAQAQNGGTPLPFAKLVARMANLMVGLPDYDSYVEHRRLNHPDQPVMSREEFFRERQEARYSGKVGRCC
ncbi:YbdD/YjiX family protein [Nitrospirillum sp. BR 11828]|uniref:YbdD/YjiX family protein n=1 Tax=Nitrospirillum sp. BR 11828 TaxID=3104325 RepID=UPI002ACA4171|nr:YbdD/YjiX family protein [Nitrospirillum sp. BR 11828]MDZ5649284.1 YbdD/YjiX family protein [Nitrospirillum sp. BR 11828]